MKDHSILYRRGLYLEYFTVVYNVAEAILSMLFGYLAGSVALVGFGLDSIVETLSGLVLIWRLRGHGNLTEEEEEKIEKRAGHFVAATFFILAVYVLYESIEKLIRGIAPGPSVPGIILALASLIIMPVLAGQKYRIGQAIGSSALISDSKETLACAWLSGALLIGLAMNYFIGFWQADPITGLVIVGFLAKEGWEILHEEKD